MIRSKIGPALFVAGALLAPAGALAQGSAADEIAKYRQMLQDGNPADLLIGRGEDLWKTPAGPNKVSLEQCDLGLGPGVIKGAYARLPRWFKDADAVQDFETRLVWCMTTLQGIPREQATRKPYSGTAERQTDIESIVAFVVEQSRGVPVQVPQEHAKERAAHDRGRTLFYTRGGPYDFSCSTCHGSDAKRIRLQDLPNLERTADAQRAFTTWPAYRVSQGAFRSMQWRIYDCFRQQRFPELIFTSQASIDLITYLGVKANGGKMDSPAIKR